MKHIFLPVILLLASSNLNAFPSFDGALMTSIQKDTLVKSSQHKKRNMSGENILSSNIDSTGSIVDIWQNDFSNQTIRDEESKNLIFNQTLTAQSDSIDACEDISLSNLLNDLSCQSKTNLSRNSQKYIDEVVLPNKIASDHINDSITDLEVISVSTSPNLLDNEVPDSSVDKLTNTAFKASANAALNSVKEDRYQVLNSIDNSVKDDFSVTAIKSIEQAKSRSYLLRRLAIMNAKALYAQIFSFKHSIETEQVLATELLSINKRVNGV